MLPIYICEDVEEELMYFNKFIGRTIAEEGLDAGVVCVAKTPGQLLSHLRDHQCQSLYFLDIDLKSNMNGIELGKEIRKYDPRGFIVLVTTYDSLSPFAFKYRIEAMDYIVKDKDDVKMRIAECIKVALERYDGTCLRDVKMVNIPVRNGIQTFFEDEIYCFESSRYGIYLHKRVNSILIDSTLAGIQKELDDTFYRCGKYCIVNLSRVASIDRPNHKAILGNGRECEASARSIKAFEEYYNNYIKRRQDK